MARPDLPRAGRAGDEQVRHLRRGSAADRLARERSFARSQRSSAATSAGGRVLQDVARACTIPATARWGDLDPDRRSCPGDTGAEGCGCRVAASRVREVVLELGGPLLILIPGARRSSKRGDVAVPATVPGTIAASTPDTKWPSAFGRGRAGRLLLGRRFGPGARLLGGSSAAGACGSAGPPLEAGGRSVTVPPQAPLRREGRRGFQRAPGTAPFEDGRRRRGSGACPRAPRAPGAGGGSPATWLVGRGSSSRN